MKIPSKLRAANFFLIFNLAQSSSSSHLTRPSLPSYFTLTPPLVPTTDELDKEKMSTNRGGEGVTNPSSNPKVTKLRELIADHSSASEAWEKCWEKGVTPWDLGQPTPVIKHLLQTGNLPKGRILVPGCGNGYDVVAMATPERYVLGLDISISAVKRAEQWSSSFPNARHFGFLAADFFTWRPTVLFDLVFDYTFFCAVDPSMRPSWAKKISEILKPEGELITLIYLISEQQSGPPYNNSVADYEEVLAPLGFRALSIVDNELAIGPRRGKEKLGRWKRCVNRSSF